MGRRSSVYSLPEDLRDEVCSAFRNGKTGDELIAQIRAAGYTKISRSALYRFLHTDDELLKRHKLLSESAKIWAKSLADDPNGNVARLCEQMLSVIAHGQVKRLFDEGAENIDPADVELIARTLRHVETAMSMGAAREMKIREMIAAKVDEKIGEARARGIDPAVLEQAKLLVRGAVCPGGLSRDTAAAIREAIAKVDI
jgi:hypothetical protein